MITPTLSVATVPIAVMDHADVINVCRYCAHNRTSFKYEALRLITEQSTHLFGMDASDSIETGRLFITTTLFVTEKTMASNDNKRKYTDDHREEEEEAEESTVTSKKQRMSGDNDDCDSSSSTYDFSSSKKEMIR
jgi:hypothetical protein